MAQPPDALKNNTLYVIDPISMALIRTVSMPFLDYRGIAVAANGDIFAPIWGAGIAEISPTGTELATTPMPANYATGSPNSIAVSSDGNLVVGTAGGFVIEMTTSFTNETVFSVGSGGNTYVNFLRATPTITWGNPADITYGTAARASQLNAEIDRRRQFQLHAGRRCHAGERRRSPCGACAQRAECDLHANQRRGH